MLLVLTDVLTAIARLASSVLSVKEGIDPFTQYKHFLASHEVTFWLYPSDLRNILPDIKNEIFSHPRLELPNDLDVNISAFY